MHQSVDRSRLPREVPLERTRMSAAVAASQIMQEHVRGAVELPRRPAHRNASRCSSFGKLLRY